MTSELPLTDSAFQNCKTLLGSVRSLCSLETNHATSSIFINLCDRDLTFSQERGERSQQREEAGSVQQFYIQWNIERT
jgi:hypothetical protein